MLRDLMPGIKVVTTGELFEKNDMGFAGWIRFIFEGQRASEVITDIIIDEPWVGNATREILQGKGAGDDHVPGAFARSVPVFYWATGHEDLQPEGAQVWSIPPGAIKVPARDERLLLYRVHTVARPAVLCGCGGCKGLKSHTSTSHGFLPGGSRHDGQVYKGQKQRPWAAEHGGYALALTEAHRLALESWAPPADDESDEVAVEEE